MIYDFMCQQWPSALYSEQTRQSPYRKINGHVLGIKNHIGQKPTGQHLNFPGHSIADIKIALDSQKNICLGFDFSVKFQWQTFHNSKGTNHNLKCCFYL